MALKRWNIVGKTAAVTGALLGEEIWRRNWRRHDGGFKFCRKQTELLAADVETCGADEGPPPGGTRAGRNGSSHRRSWRRAWWRWTASWLQWKVIWDKTKSKLWNGAREREKWWDTGTTEYLKTETLCTARPACFRWTGTQNLKRKWECQNL